MNFCVLLLDDHQIFIEGLGVLLRNRKDIDSIDSANSGAEALERVRTKNYDLIIMDVCMPGIDGVQTLVAMGDYLKNSRIIALSSASDARTVQAMLHAGAHGYVLKSNAFADLNYAIDAVCKGNRYISPTITDIFLSSNSNNIVPENGGDLWDLLTEREQEILKLICEDRIPKEIAHRLGISRKTVDVHKRNMMAKLGVSSIMGLLRVVQEKKFYYHESHK